MVTCSICTIGDELLIGQVVDTNSASIAKALNQIGISVQQICSIGDNREDIVKTIELLLNNSDILIITGGLGPTKDDITKSALAECTGSTHFCRSAVQEANIEAFCKKRGKALFEINRIQADVPNTCDVLENRLGTAPGMWFEYKGKVIVSLPGVPYEMEGLLPQVLDRVHNRFGASLLPITHKTLSTIGIPESVLATQIADWENQLPPNLHLAYLPNPRTGVRLRLSCYGLTDGAEKINQAFSQLEPLLGDAIYGYGDETLEEVIAKLLIQNSATLSCAESCTGGRIGAIFTSMAGASKYFKGGVIAYDNTIKEHVLGVSSQLIKRYGAVSQQCVESMATGVQRLMQSDFAIATSGIAGPDGGTDEKPVGTVWIAVATPQKCTSKTFLFASNRLTNIEWFSAMALNMLRKEIMNEELLNNQI